MSKKEEIVNDLIYRFRDAGVSIDHGGKTSYTGLQMLIRNYCESHRHYHNLSHLIEMLDFIDNAYVKGSIKIHQRRVFYLAALFHDICYLPGWDGNEEASFSQLVESNLLEDQEEVDLAHDLIMSTVNHDVQGFKFRQPEHQPLALLFCKADLRRLRRDFTPESASSLIKIELAILKEYQNIPFPEYQEHRCQFLEAFTENPLVNGESVNFMLNFTRHYRPKIGVYAGSFWPFHVGHMSILEKAEKIFDKVIVVQGVNPDKDKSLRHQYNNIEQALPFHEIVDWNSLTTTFLQKVNEYADVTLIRGLRNGYDLQHETNQLRYMQGLWPEINVIHIVCDNVHEHVSSSSLRNLSHFNDAEWQRYLPQKYAYYHSKYKERFSA